MNCTIRWHRRQKHDPFRVGVEPNGATPEAGETFLKAKYGKWERVIRSGNIKPQ